MAKRKLTKQQHLRVKARQNSKLDIPTETNSINDTTGEQGVVIANFGKTVLVEDENSNEHTCNIRQNLGTLVCGDNIVWQREENDNNVVVAVQQRHNFLARHGRQNQAKVIAANIDQILVVTAIKPALNTRLIDRYIVAAELSRITPVIVFNKIDLSENNIEEYKEQLKIYSELGYQLIMTSAKQSQGMDEVQSCLSGKTSAVVGQSGVGKSSLLNAIHPGVNAEVAAISNSTNKGRHTTTLARLYHLPCNGSLIDSPGIREFGLWQIQSDQLINGFTELKSQADHCRFRDCLHEDEPGCGVREAVEKGQVTKQRWESYRRILETLRDDG